MSMSWIRQKDDKKHIRVTFIVRQDKDADLYETLVGLRYGSMSSFIREALRAYARQKTNPKVETPEPVARADAQPPERPPVTTNTIEERMLSSEDIDALRSLNKIFF